MTANQTIRWVLKPAVFLAALIPFGLLVQRLVNGNLGADPLKEITNQTGLWTLRLLCLTLMITPLRRLSGWNAAIRFRRMLGLFAFFYGSVHWTALTASIGEEILKRPYITVGFTSWVCMLALALTSTAGMKRRLGGKRWQRLHRAIYVAAVTGVVHFWWLVKADVREPRFYAVVVGVLLAFRLAWWGWTRNKRASAAAARPKMANC